MNRTKIINVYETLLERFGEKIHDQTATVGVADERDDMDESVYDGLEDDDKDERVTEATSMASLRRDLDKILKKGPKSRGKAKQAKKNSLITHASTKDIKMGWEMFDDYMSHSKKNKR